MAGMASPRLAEPLPPLKTIVRAWRARSIISCNRSPGLDFETRLFYKPNAATLLDVELRKPGYQPAMISLGANTDPYQPVELRLGITRGILEVLARFRHPVAIVTKGAALIERDLDLLQYLAQDNLVSVAISITTLDAGLKRSLEPRAAAPQSRLRAMRRLSDAGFLLGCSSRL